MSVSILTSNTINNSAGNGLLKSTLDRYLAYCDRKGKEKIYWYMKAIIIIPCVIMVPSIIAFHATGVPHEFYVGFCMLLFFSNIIAHIAELSSRYYIPLYHITLVIMISIPAITYIISNT